MTDLFAEASSVVSNEEKQANGITIDTILKEPSNRWNTENITTGYASCWPIARLAIAAFSNYPNPNYQHIVSQGRSIFAKTKTDTGREVKINDFIYGSMCDPLYIAEQYDGIVGKPGAYFELCKPIDKMVDRCAYLKQSPTVDEIKQVITKIEQFATLNTFVKTEQGIYSKQYADKIMESFNIVKNQVQKEYGVKDDIEKCSTQEEILKNEGQFNSAHKKEGWFKKIANKIKEIFTKNDKTKMLPEGMNENSMRTDFFESIKVDNSVIRSKTPIRNKNKDNGIKNRNYERD